MTKLFSRLIFRLFLDRFVDRMISSYEVRGIALLSKTENEVLFGNRWQIKLESLEENSGRFR